MSLIYLAHSVHERERGKSFAKELEGCGYTVYNPFYPTNPRGDIKALDDGIIQPWEIPDKERSVFIVEIDLEAVRKSDMFVALYPDFKTVGIPCEMMYAWLNHIPIYVVVPKSLAGHPWIIGLSKSVTEQENELLFWLSEKIVLCDER